MKIDDLWLAAQGRRVRQIPIEERDPDEVRYIQGLGDTGVVNVLVPPADSPAIDVTPAGLVTGFITSAA